MDRGSTAFQRLVTDERLLAQVGVELFGQHARVLVHLSREVADNVRAAWTQQSPLQEPDGTLRQRMLQRRSGFLALIGRAIEERGRVIGDEVVVDLDAWEIGTALDAAEDLDMSDWPHPY